MKWAYYNEFNLEAAAWLQQLIREGLIMDGEVDTRSIVDVRADDLTGFVRVGFFAGIGGWDLALQRAGWPRDRPVWHGSCPCQPFSSAGRQEGTSDERHLWPVFARLIAQCRPPVVLGEQVDSAIGHGWLDGVCADLEAEGYAVGAAVLPACGIGAPHRRNRLWWAGVLADTGSAEPHRAECATEGGREDTQVAGGGAGSSVVNAKDGGVRGVVGSEVSTNGSSCGGGEHEGMRRDEQPPAGNVAVHCADGKCRRVPTESVLQRVDDGISLDLDRMRDPRNGYPLCEKKAVPHRRQLLHGYGNAIHPDIAAVWIRAVMV